eukprot:TRINITY_DN55417_c0_g1_i1.p1 TRINITY_DN55417_c0_g1~~TRINITY_DN55417_c0_g1_i1.p1  ORF type:complete len:526 (+),score=136.04 TRINITY_DN55417_c0_g1_i1:97-1578(+)
MQSPNSAGGGSPSPTRRKGDPRPVRRLWLKREQGAEQTAPDAPRGDEQLAPQLAAPSPQRLGTAAGGRRPLSRAGSAGRPDSRQSNFSAFSHTLPPATPGRNAPARRRPLVDRHRIGAQFSSDMRPPSAGPSQLSLDERLSLPDEDFESELAMIGQLNLAEKAAQQKYVLPPTVSPAAEPDVTEQEQTLTDLQAQSGGVGRPIHVPYRPDLRAKMSADTRVHTHLAQKPMSFRDYQLLAEACQRAGKARMEGHAYYKQGELLAQSRDTLRRSLLYFKKYLNISRRLNDLQGEAKALNCVGIVHQELNTPEDLRKALEYHQQHCEIADAAGIFIANTNIGLLYGRLGDLSRSIEHHKQALQFAVRAGDKQAEALALANLGLMGRTQGDHVTAKVCIERHLELSSGMRDDEASCDAYEQLGLLSSERRDWAPASDYLLQAMDLSAKQGNQEKTNAIRCKIGFVNGTMRMEEHFRNVAKLMGAKQEKRRRRSSGGM